MDEPGVNQSSEIVAPSGQELVVQKQLRPKAIPLGWSFRKKKAIHNVLRSLTRGAAIYVACKAAAVSDYGFHKWRKACPRLDHLARDIYTSRIHNVEDICYARAMKGSDIQIQYFLNNRARRFWARDPENTAPEVNVNVSVNNDQSVQVKQEFKQPPILIFRDIVPKEEAHEECQNQDQPQPQRF